MLRPLRWLSALLLVTVLTGCAEPPNKEMNQAQGAIDAARAAGADRYASSELAAAVDSLERSEAAVTQNDYRLALSLAIESRERAQAAANVAADTRAKARGAAERIVTEANSMLTQVRDKWNDEALGKLPRRTASDTRDTFAAAEKSMQEARAALEREEYDQATSRARAVSTQIRELVAALTKPPAAAPARKRR
jgi:hypothetical protein